MADHADRVAVVIDDDADIRDLISMCLADAGFGCYATGDGAEGVALVQTFEAVVVTLDLGLVGMDGLEVARRIRQFSNAYIMVVSARTEEIDLLLALDAGADDYLTKPFRPRVLRARIESAMRRRIDPGIHDDGSTPDIGLPDEPQWERHNGLRLNRAMHLCEVDEEPIDLTRTEFILLSAILAGERRVISKDSLARDIHGRSHDSAVTTAERRGVETHVAHLRRKLQDSPRSPRFIETVQGVGYRLTATLE